MTRELPATGLVLLLLLAGCATSPSHVTPVATISNAVTLEYAFGRGSHFRVRSASAEVVALVPRDSGFDARAAARAEARVPGAPGPSAPGSGLVTPDSHLGTRRAGGPDSGEDGEAGSSDKLAVAGESHHALVAVASQEDRTGNSTSEERLRAASGKAVSLRSSVAAKEFTASGHWGARRSGVEHRFAHARLDARSAGGSSDWRTAQPAIRKWATPQSVVVGGGFEYVVEIENTCPLDLASAVVTDVLDPRLSVAASAVRTISYGKAEVTLREGLLSVRLPRGIRRGHTVRILIPAVLQALSGPRSEDVPRSSGK